MAAAAAPSISARRAALRVLGQCHPERQNVAPLLEAALGPRKLWIAAFSNDCFGYLPTAKVLAEGGYETRCLYAEPGFFPPEVEGVVLAKVRQMAERVGRALPE